MRSVFLDYDTRREPRTTRFCVRCQRDIGIDHPARIIRVLDELVLHPDDAGTCGEEFLIGLDCAHQIGLEYSRPEQYGKEPNT